MKTIPNIMRKLFLLTLITAQVAWPNDSCMPGVLRNTWVTKASERFEAATGISAFAGIAIGAAAWTVSTAAFMYATWRYRASEVKEAQKEKDAFKKRFETASADLGTTLTEKEKLEGTQRVLERSLLLTRKLLISARVQVQREKNQLDQQTRQETWNSKTHNSRYEALNTEFNALKLRLGSTEKALADARRLLVLKNEEQQAVMNLVPPQVQQSPSKNVRSSDLGHIQLRGTMVGYLPF